MQQVEVQQVAPKELLERDSHLVVRSWLSLSEEKARERCQMSLSEEKDNCQDHVCLYPTEEREKERTAHGDAPSLLYGFLTVSLDPCF